MTIGEEIRAGKRCRVCRADTTRPGTLGATYPSGRVTCADCDEHEREEKSREEGDE